MADNKPHLLLSNIGTERLFAPKSSGGRTSYPASVTDRTANARRIVDQLTLAISSVELSKDPVVDKESVPITIKATTQWGVTHSLPGSKNRTLSVLGHNEHARLNVSFHPQSLVAVQTAAEKYISYSESDPRKPNHFNFFEAVPTVALTSVEDVWTSRAKPPEDEKEISWEVWLFSHSEARFRQALEILNIKNPRRGVQFGDVTVLAMVGTRSMLERVVRSASVTQLRPASTLNTSLLNMPAAVQQQAILVAAAKVKPAPANAPAVCILDTGVYKNHPLLKPSLRYQGVVGGKYTPDDHDGHGTKMAGVALYSDLGKFLTGGVQQHSYSLESVCIQRPLGLSTSPMLPAELVKEGVAQVEASIWGTRTYCLAMNAPEDPDDGSPSSFSSELDALAFEVANRRLFCVAAGNLNTETVSGDYQSLNEITGIMSPGQSWNALTVGACTDLCAVPQSHQPVAPAGDLSPFSRTAVNWERLNRPPNKPDVVFEGGNQMIDVASNTVGAHRDLFILTTSADPAAPLTLTGETSPATAAVAGLCAGLQARYPTYWPETIRALVIHSAEHTPAMKDRVRGVESEGEALVQRFGFGQPDRVRAFNSASNVLTLINQDTLHPYRLNDRGDNVVLGQMAFVRLPWPTEVLEQLGEEVAELKVTLSYFIEPNPGALVAGNYDDYASHGLDFDVIRPDENEEQAVFRINSLGRPNRKSTARPLDWDFSKRGRGSIKHDRWRGYASDLARMGGVMIYPRRGWWAGDQTKWEQIVRYSLVVSIRTREADIYSSVETKVATLV
ncbi:S8 family peptidase [Ensifer sp. ENS04]|uniref:S8 family peptidase n=1 Tax=Ensifer sp. ENS04 TaxID=2769281 RepID=UPI0017826FD8|nr:S8 family peptidase [Ensifer sp. ENS04]MBD9541740.1 S8 family peptidase [Ensifer sp. ENS04]